MQSLPSADFAVLCVLRIASWKCVDVCLKGFSPPDNARASKACKQGYPCGLQRVFQLHGGLKSEGSCEAEQVQEPFCILRGTAAALGS